MFTWRALHAPACGLPKIQNRVGELVMVENVGEDGLEFGAKALVDVDVLLDLEVDVPERHAAKHAAAASTAVQSQNRVTDAGKDGLQGSQTC